MELFDERTVLWLARMHKWRLASADSPAPPSPGLHMTPLALLGRQN
jgi:hypothetical protein